MTNDEMEKVMNFLIHRQEVFAENQEKMQSAIATLAQAQTNLAEAQTQTQRDISNLSKIVSGLVDIVIEGRNGK